MTMRCLLVFALCLVAVVYSHNCHEQRDSTEVMPGAYIPRCEDDGTFSAVQCHGSSCFCAEETGAQIGTYNGAIYTFADMNCNCARDQQKYQKTGMIGLMFNCIPNGNYDSIQCTGSVCFCVDANGQQIGADSVNIGSISSLKC